jgi:leucyl-tRNA synthetase
VVIPDAFIQRWGADTFRMYLMFLGPFREGGDFRDEGITGVRRFLDKVWALVHEAAQAQPLPLVVERKLHQTIHKVTADTESLDYNTAIAAMMEYVNLVREQAAGQRAAIEPLLVLLAPYAPHIAEELWAHLGHETSVFQARWPVYDDQRAASGDVEIVVQVNGKVRGRLTVERGAGEADVLTRALADESVRKFVDGKLMKKTIYVPDRLLNLVV